MEKISIMRGMTLIEAEDDAQNRIKVMDGIKAEPVHQ
jgi:hypothetical protein